MKWLISSRGSNFSCSYNMVPDLKLWPSHGHVNPVCVGPPAQVLLMVSIVNSVVKFIINLRQPVLSSILVINCKIKHLLKFSELELWWVQLTLDLPQYLDTYEWWKVCLWMFATAEPLSSDIFQTHQSCPEKEKQTQYEGHILTDLLPDSESCNS